MTEIFRDVFRGRGIHDSCVTCAIFLLQRIVNSLPDSRRKQKELKPKHRRSCVCQVTSLSLSQPLAEDQGCRWLIGSWSRKEHLRKPCLLTRAPDLLSSPRKTRRSRRAYTKALKPLQVLLTHSQKRTRWSSHMSDLCYTWALKCWHSDLRKSVKTKKKKYFADPLIRTKCVPSEEGDTLKTRSRHGASVSANWKDEIACKLLQAQHCLQHHKHSKE